jgi:hypothetical protein
MIGLSGHMKRLAEFVADVLGAALGAAAHGDP